jgi:hypothetical protein
MPMQNLLDDMRDHTSHGALAASRAEDEWSRRRDAVPMSIGPWVGRAGRPRLLRSLGGESRRPQTWIPVTGRDRRKAVGRRSL